MLNNIKKTLLLGLILSILCLTMMSAVSAATTWNITANYTSDDIQNIIDDDTIDGDTLSFAEDSPYYNISLVIDKSLNLQGNGATLNYNESNPVVLNIINTNNVVINGFTIYGGNAILANNSEKLIIKNNTISMGTEDDAIRFISVKKALIKYNEFFGNYIGRDAIGLVNSSNIIIYKNNMSYFNRNGISLAAGRLGELNDSSTYNILIKKNYIYDVDFGIFFGGGVSHVDIKYNELRDFISVGINIARSCTDILIKNNTIGESYGGPINIGIIIEENNNFHDPQTPTKLNNLTVIGNLLQGEYIGIRLLNLDNATYWQDQLLANNTFDGDRIDIQIVP